jgi:tetratricopeptide (TPR) repeat protein
VTRARWLQWSRTAFALAALFASFALTARRALGEWAFEGAGGFAGLWFAAGVYLFIRGRRLKPAPDPAALLDEAIHLATAGDTARAIGVLNRAIAENPWFWQALQSRAEIRFHLGDVEQAVADFDAAIRLAPDEPHLRELREQAVSGPSLPSPDGNS